MTPPINITIIHYDQLFKSINTFSRLYWIDMLVNELSATLNDQYGQCNWLAIPTDELPSDFSLKTYTIENGQLIKASDELIADRDASAKAVHNEQQRKLREEEYRALTDPMALELIADADPSIVAIKNEIRDKYPYQE